LSLDARKKTFEGGSCEGVEGGEFKEKGGEVVNRHQERGDGMEKAFGEPIVPGRGVEGGQS